MCIYKYVMALGIYGEHAQETCPLYNEQNRKFLLANVPSQEKNAQRHDVKILHQYHSALEHTSLWVVEADNPHLIEELMARTAGRMNTLKIVPLITFQTVIERCKKIEEGSFFS
jgi:uncharacterized protein DUF3303